MVYPIQLKRCIPLIEGHLEFFLVLFLKGTMHYSVSSFLHNSHTPLGPLIVSHLHSYLQA